MDQSSGLKIVNGILKEYTGQSSDVIIPDNVKGISSAVFKDRHALRSVILPAGLETIESRCFDGCDGLTTVMFSSGLTKIGKYAFAGCSNLKIHRLPAGLEEIGAYAFKDCTSLSSLEIPESVREIGVGAFDGCTGLTSVRMPGRYTSVASAFGTHPFTGCTELKIYAPAGSEAEKCGMDNGIQVINISARDPVAPAGGAKAAAGKTANNDALDAAYSGKPKTPAKRSAPAGKIKFGFGTPDSAGSSAAEKLASGRAAAERAEAERQAALRREQEEKEKQKTYDEAVSLYESGAESDMQKAAEMMRSLGSFGDSRRRAREFAGGLKKKQKEARKAEAEKARQDRIRAAELKKAAAQEQTAESSVSASQKPFDGPAKAAAPTKPAKPAPGSAVRPERKGMSLPRPDISRKAVIIILAVVVAIGAGIGTAFYISSHRGSGGGGGGGYTLTLEDYINSNDAAKQQLVQSVEGTDVIISVSGNTLIYTYDLSASNSMTPEIAESEELKQSLGETLDASDEQFTELCSGLEKDTGISGVSVEVLFKYGDDVLLTRTYTSEGRQQ